MLAIIPIIYIIIEINDRTRTQTPKHVCRFTTKGALDDIYFWIRNLFTIRRSAWINDFLGRQRLTFPFEFARACLLMRAVCVFPPAMRSASAQRTVSVGQSPRTDSTTSNSLTSSRPPDQSVFDASPNTTPPKSLSGFCVHVHTLSSCTCVVVSFVCVCCFCECVDARRSQCGGRTC